MRCRICWLHSQPPPRTRWWTQKSSSICKHYFGDHYSNVPPCLSEQFHVLTKCTNKFDCLIKEMLFIRKLKPSPKRANRFDSWEGIHLKNLWSFVVMLICRDYLNQTDIALFILICLENGVTMTPKRRLLTLILLAYALRNRYWTRIIIIITVLTRWRPKNHRSPTGKSKTHLRLPQWSKNQHLHEGDNGTKMAWNVHDSTKRGQRNGYWRVQVTTKMEKHTLHRI